jgi:hypothetical protein
MPETHWRFGYPFVLVLMVAVTIAILIFFRYKGWIWQGSDLPTERRETTKASRKRSPSRRDRGLDVRG